MDYSDSDEERPSIIQEVVFYDKPGLPKYSKSDLFINRRKLLRSAKPPTIIEHELEDLYVKTEDIIKTEEVIVSDNEEAEMDANLRTDKHVEDLLVENEFAQNSSDNIVEIQSSDIGSRNDIEDALSNTKSQDTRNSLNNPVETLNLKVYGRRKNIKITPKRQDLLDALKKSSCTGSLQKAATKGNKLIQVSKNLKQKASENNVIQCEKDIFTNTANLDSKKSAPVNIISVRTVQTGQPDCVTKIITISEGKEKISDSAESVQSSTSSHESPQLCGGGTNSTQILKSKKTEDAQTINNKFTKSETAVQTLFPKQLRSLQCQTELNKDDPTNHVIKSGDATPLNKMGAVPVNNVKVEEERPENEIEYIDDDDQPEWVPEDYAEYKLKHAAKKRRPGAFRAHKCKICLGIFKSYYLLCKHKQIHLKKQNPYECRQCDSSFQDINTFTAHIRWHQGKNPYPCKKCDEGFDCKEDLDTHSRIHVLKKNPPKVKRFRCDICRKEFSKLCDMERHTRVHTGEKPAECNICHKRFQQTHNLSKHLLTHLQVKPFICDICNKKFGRIDVLNRHLLTHSLEKPFKCMLCPKGFIRVAQLQNHMRKNHREVEFDKSRPNAFTVAKRRKNQSESDETVDDLEIQEKPAVIYSLDDEEDQDMPETDDLLLESIEENVSERVDLSLESIEDNQDNKNKKLLETNQKIKIQVPMRKAASISQRYKVIQSNVKKRTRPAKVENKEHMKPQPLPEKAPPSRITIATRSYKSDPNDIMESILNPQEDQASQVIKIID